jgi:phage head maturation protease
MTLDERKSKASHYAVKDGSGDLSMMIKDIDTGSRVVTGFFNTYNYVDSDSDILMMGCAKNSIKQRGADSNAVAKIKHCLFHDMTQLVGKIQVLDEREVNGVSGIYFETKMADTEIGNDTLKNYIAGVYDNHSIGFQYMWDKVKVVEVNTAQWDEMAAQLVNPKDLAGKTQVYLVKEIKLWEGSTVAFGANLMTPFLGVKSGMKKDAMILELDTKMKKVESVLRNGTQTDDMMEALNIQLMQMKQFMNDIIVNAEFKDMKQELKPEPQVNVGIDYAELRKSLK